MKMTIRLKLTLWYSLILILTMGAYSLITNTIAERQLHRTPEEIAQEMGLQHPIAFSRSMIAEIRERDLRNIQLASMILFGVLMVLSFGGGYIIAGQMLQPLRKINSAAREVTANNLRISVEHVNANDELGELVNNFNAMLSRLHTSFDLQKQFVANASHELKTPLTISQTNIERVLHDVHISREELEQTLQKAVESTTFMNHLIEDLLLLSMMQEHIAQEPVHIDAMTKTAVTQLEPFAAQQQKALTYTINPGVHIPEHIGNSTLLQRAVMNCIENAIKYARTRVDVRIARDADRTRITISDDGIGIPKEHVEKVWERFYRADTSRSRASGGTGLGLAITKSIIEKHGGRVSLTSTVNEGTTVTLTI